MKKEQFDTWAGTFCQAVDGAPAELLQACLGVDAGDEAELIGIEPGEDMALVSYADQAFAEPRQVAMMATMVQWSPTAHGESSPAWAIVVVDRGVRSFFGVRRLVEDDRWWRLEPTDAPWFLLSTASSLRAMMCGEPMTLKRIDGDADPNLLRRPFDAPHPRVDDKGRL